MTSSLDSSGRLSLIRLQLAWLLLVGLAVAYCGVHSLLMQSPFDWRVTCTWAVSRWGAWPLLLPLLWAVHQRPRKGSRQTLAWVRVACVSVGGVSLTWHLVNLTQGRDESFLTAAYQAAPVAAATFGFFLAAALMPLKRPSETEIAGAFSPRYLTVWRGSHEIQLPYGDIELIKAAGNYVEIYANGREYLLRHTLTGLIESLGDPFVQIHRSWAVNCDRIDRVRRRSRGAFVLTDGGLRAPVSRRLGQSLDWLTPEMERSVP